MGTRGSWAVGLVALAVLGGCKSAPKPLPPLPAESAATILKPPGTARIETTDSSVVDRVVAVVNEDVILMSELQEAVALYLKETRETMPVTTEERERLLQKVLDRMIDHRLQIQEARRDKIEVSEDELATVLDDFVKRNGGDRARVEERLRAEGLSWEIVRRDIRESLLAQKVRFRRIGRRASVTEAEVDAYLAENRAKFEADLKYHPRHIAVLVAPPGGAAAWEAARAEAEEIVARVRAGEDFAELAKARAAQGGDAAGGDLGWLKPGELAPEFERPILALRAGEVTAPIRSDNGYHLFRLEEREELTPETLAQLRQQARDILVQRKAQERLDEWMQGLRQRALIAERL